MALKNNPSEDSQLKYYSLKRQTKTAADDMLIFCFYLSKEMRLDFLMWILCLAEDSLETSSLIFSEKQWHYFRRGWGGGRGLACELKR